MSPTNADIMRELGAMGAEMKHASESRGQIHSKLEAQNVILDETAKTLAEVGFGLKVTTDVAVQARDRIAKFEQEFREHQVPIIAAAAQFQIDTAPIISVMKTVRNIVVTMLGLGLLSAGGVIVAAFTARDWLAAGVRWVLGI
jgi:hypothetical protein